MPEGITIHHASAADVNDVHQLECAAFPSPWRREFFESEVHGSGRFNLVVRRQGRLIGYLFAMWFFDELHINKIAVDEQERRKGIADTLMAECIAFAKRNRIRLMSLEVRESNRGAQAFYRHLDFTPAYVRPMYYPDGEAAVVMTKNL
ncbi:MAG TPA: ribosomal protein S18-alanine N-acetyltransferase [Thermoanaerobaculia bacterium]|nr:ribosomal protein S18-alanine N-acetyltransferase [Thermoanaerobaculia bacterium]